MKFFVAFVRKIFYILTLFDNIPWIPQSYRWSKSIVLELHYTQHNQKKSGARLKANIIVLILTIICASSLPGDILRVPTEYQRIQTAIDSSVDGDTVLVAGGIYYGTGNKNLNFRGREIVLLSEADPRGTIIDCQYQGRGISFHHGESRNAVLSGFTIKRGRSLDGGGAVFISSSSPILENCYFSDNSAITGSSGGGVYMTMGAGPLINRCLINGNYSESEGGGICLDRGSSLILVNCTVSENQCARGGGLSVGNNSQILIRNTIFDNNQSGIYLAATAQPAIAYCDFHNNFLGHLTGASIPNIGRIVTVNNNGDSCDVYFNLFRNPLYYSITGDSAYYLTAQSPCVDAGDPATPRDPDYTVADIGALYYHHQTVGITMVLMYPPLMLPPGGGLVEFELHLEYRYGVRLENLDAWTEIVLPDRRRVGPLLFRSGINLPQGASIVRRLAQIIPGYAPPGTLTLYGYIGVYPDSILGDDSVQFEKMIVYPDFEDYTGWACSGWDDKDETSAIRHSEFILHPCSPNPFNPATTLSFTLPNAADISLTVYDIQGGAVARLADGWMTAGTHEIAFDGANLPSGVYLTQFRAGNYTKTQKLLLLK